MQKGPSSYLKQVELLPVLSRTATATGTGVDVSNFSHARVALIRSTFTGDESVTVTIEESNDDVTYVPISGAAFTAITTANDESAPLLGTIFLPERRKYLRAVATHNAGTGTGIYGVIIDLVDPTLGSLANNSFAFEV